jgi:hypothetical protein
VPYQRGHASLEVEVANIQSVLESLDPKVATIDCRVDSLEATRDKLDGKFVIIVWLVGVNIAILIGVMVAFCTWGLNHIQIHAIAAPMITSQANPSQISGDDSITK